MKVDKKARARININTSGDNTIIAAPGAAALLEIDHINFISSGGTNIITLKDGATTIADYTLDDNQGLVFEFPNPSEHSLKLSTNNGFIINLSNARLVTGFCLYRICGE